MPDTILFYLLAGVAIVASALVIGQRNPMYSIMLLIASFGALSGLYITSTRHSWRWRRSSSTPARSWCSSCSW
jgi:disulfide bond formation protein DsbB